LVRALSLCHRRGRLPGLIFCQYEAQWGMPFVAFSERLKADPADPDNFSYSITPRHLR